MTRMDETQPFPRQEPHAGSGMSPTTAAAISYVFGIVSGVVILLIEKDRFARFHAAQSILLSAAWVAAWIAISLVTTFLSFLPFVGFMFGWMLWMALWAGLGLGGLALWVAMIVVAAQGRRVALPVIGPYAEQIAAH
jgi:uncharacterized membrane protein